MIITDAVVGRQPTTSARHQQCAIGPAVGMDRVNQDHITLIEWQSDGAGVLIAGRVVWVESPEVGMKLHWSILFVESNVLLGGVRSERGRHFQSLLRS